MFDLNCYQKEKKLENNVAIELRKMNNGESDLPEPSNTKRIAKNTLMLYSRQVLSMLLGLYTVRVVLNVLGTEDYGIYGVVGGIVTFFSFLSSTMASATQRFFSFALGKNDIAQLKKTFSVNFIIYIMIAVLSFILLETIGLWYVNNKLAVPELRFEAARKLFHYSVLSFLASIITSPFLAIIIAHEDMSIYALLSIFEVTLKLVIVYFLKILNIDKLVLYGALLFIVQIGMALVYLIICLLKYNECQFKKIYWSNDLFKETIGFTGWTLFGAFSGVGRNQAVTILINQFFNPIVSAARVIAVNVNNYVNVFSSNFNTSLYPPIVKEYASDNKNEMFKLIFNGSKITFFLLWIFALPLFLHMDYVLTLWLKNPPENAVLFTRLALIETLINSSALPIMTAARAHGRMKWYELPLGTLQICIFVVDWILFKIGYGAWIVFIIAACGNAIMYIFRLIFIRNLIQFPILHFVYKVLLPLSIVMVISAIPSLFISIIVSNKFFFVLLSVLFSVLCNIIAMLFIGIDKNTRKLFYSIIKRKLLISHENSDGKE